MVSSKYNKKTLLLLIPVGILLIGLVVTLSLALSSRSLDDRTRAVSEVGMSLSPAAGKITADGLDIDLIIDTHGKTIFGVDITLEYSSSIDYVRFSQGNLSNCFVRDVRQGATKVNLHCLIDPRKSYSGSGDIFAKVFFEATDSGTAKIDITEVLFSDSTGEISFLGGNGEYETDFTESKVALDLDPKSGTITREVMDINLIIDTHEEEIGGVDSTLQYSGDIEYVGFKQGELNDCYVSETNLGEKKLGFYCFVEPSKPVYSGSGDIFATLEFRSTGLEGGEINITEVVFSVRDDRNEISVEGGSGTYFTSEDGSPIQPPGEDPPGEVPIVQPPSCGTMNNAVFPYTMQDWASKAFCKVGLVEPLVPIFPALGGTTTWRCFTDGKESEFVSCSVQREKAPVKCGSLNDRTFTYNTEAWPAGEFCLDGQPNPISPVFPALGSETIWQCVGSDGSTASCKSARETAPLPDASIFDSVGILGGLGLVLTALTIFIYKGSDIKENYSMRDKLSW